MDCVHTFVCVLFPYNYGLSIHTFSHVCSYLYKFRPDLCFCASRAMSPDELVYLGILAASIPVGFLFRYLSQYFGT